MSSIKTIKQRVTNVKNTKQMMKAMDMVATARLQKARMRTIDIRPLYNELQNTINDLKSCEELRDNEFIAERKIKNSAYVVITSDKGLCGSYNTNVSREALLHMTDNQKNEKILIVGSKGKEFFKRREKNIFNKFAAISETQIYEDAGLMANLVKALYLSGEVDEVFLAYTYFESTLNYIPRVERILPFSIMGNISKDKCMRYEPSANIYLEHILPLYLHTYFFMAFSESVASEHAARMINMESASKNANEIIEDLTRMYNRKRQAEITQELNEIVSGANINSY